jgi:hypothetical protein
MEGYGMAEKGTACARLPGALRISGRERELGGLPDLIYAS